jgi:hypothetical protein
VQRQGAGVQGESFQRWLVIANQINVLGEDGVFEDVAKMMDESAGYFPDGGGRFVQVLDRGYGDVA